MAWRIGESRTKPKSNRTGGRLSSRAERYRNELELKHDIRESTKEIQQEQEHKVTRYHSQGDMTEEEAVSCTIQAKRSVADHNVAFSLLSPLCKAKKTCRSSWIICDWKKRRTGRI